MLVMFSLEQEEDDEPRLLAVFKVKGEAGPGEAVVLPLLPQLHVLDVCGGRGLYGSPAGTKQAEQMSSSSHH